MTAPYRIGFANLDEHSPFSVTVRESLKAAVAQHPDIELLCRENNLDDARAVANATEFAAERVNLVVMFHINERLAARIKKPLGIIPLISIDIPIPFTSFVGVNNQQAGLLAANALIPWIQSQWDGRVDKILALVDARVLEIVRQRTDFTVKRLVEQFGTPGDNIFFLDSGNTSLMALRRTSEVLTRWARYERIVVIGFNEDTTIGALDAVQSHHMADRVAVVGQGADRMLLQELQRPGTPLVATTTYHPERYGARIMEAALEIRRFQRILRETYVDISVVVRGDA